MRKLDRSTYEKVTGICNFEERETEGLLMGEGRRKYKDKDQSLYTFSVL